MVPETGSMPTMASDRPMHTATRPRTSDLPIRPMTIDMPNTRSANCSLGPKLKAKSATIGPSRARPSVEMMPPTKEPNAATFNATPALPCFANG